MSTALDLTRGVPTPRALTRWIDGPSRDLGFYMGGAVVGWIALVAHVVFGVPALALYFVWVLFLDGPHLWATLSRTYLDREERRTRRGVLIGALAWAALPISAMAWGFLTGGRLPWALFLAFVQVWAYWHVLRQHYGFLVLYQRKAGEPAGAQNRVDSWTFYVAMLAPFASFALRHPMARKDLGLPEVMSALERGLDQALVIATVLAIAVYVGKELVRFRQGAPLNVGKNLFLASCVSLHVVTLLHPTWSLLMEPLALTVVITSFHNIQYSALVWAYGKRRYHGDAMGERYGWASRVFRGPVLWYAVGVTLTVVLRYTSWSVDGRFWPFSPTTGALAGPFTAAEFVNAWWWIVAMHHYYLDQRIWRVSRDASVAAGLGLAPAR